MSLWSRIKSIAGIGQRAGAGFDHVLDPGQPFFAIGDIHGCLSNLDRILSAIRDRAAEPMIVCLGDYVDRGEHSTEVLWRLKTLSDQGGPNFVCLMGNHEEMFLQFIDEPHKYGARWLRHGGLQTLASLGIGLAQDTDLTATRDLVVDQLGQDMIDWIRALPTSWISGNVAVTHAGADPRLPVDGQPTQSHLWGHRDFAAVPRADGMWVVHGHIITARPAVIAGRIAIDTGAYATGVLTAAHVSPGHVVFLSA